MQFTKTSLITFLLFFLSLAFSQADFALAGWTQGKFNYAIDFNGQSTWVEIPHSISNIKTLSLWIKPDNLNQKILQLADGVYIEITNGEISLTGFGSAPKIYIDAQSKTTLTTNWHHLVIIADTSLTGSAIQIGKTTISATDYYFDGIIDDVRIYSYERTLDEIRLDYNAGLAVKLGGSPSQINWTYETQWLYKRKITISGSTSDLTDYQVLLTLDTQSLISQGKMRSDCGDIRVGDSTGKVLNYWIEPNTCNTTSTKIWVKVPSIPTSGTTIYLYYGNSSVSSESNAQNTFIRIIDGVVGNWHFDEGSGSTAYDSSGNDNDGTLTNGPQWVDGKYGKALSFDGSDDYVDCGTDESLNITDAITIEAWANVNDFTDSGYLVARNQGSPGTAMQYGIWISYTQEIHPVIEQTGWSSSVHVPIGSWTHITFTFDSANWKLYLDGNLEGSHAEAKTITSRDWKLLIGMRNSDGNQEYSFNGLIDEVRIYNRALTAAEISDLYNTYGYTTENYPGKVLVRKYASPEPSATVGDEQSTLMPIAHWKFEEGSGSTAYDSTPNHNNGTIYGATWVEGKYGKALKFDGDDYVEIPDAPNLDSATTQFSFSAWIKLNTTPSTEMFIIDKYSSGGTYIEGGYDIYIRPDGRLYIWTRKNTAALYTDPLTWETNKWYHIAVSVDFNTGKGYWYRNGKSLPVNYYQFGGSITDTDKPLYIGKYFKGIIDDIRIYPYTRSPDQVRIDYNAGFGIKLGGSPTNIFSGSKLYPEWKYRKPITITGSSENLTDYQVLITLDTASLISDGKMKSDCSDIRFTDADDNQTLPYWIESNCNTSQTKIWVKVPSIPTNGTTIYMYYGNLSASSASDGDTVFEFFDDFEGTTLDSSKWTEDAVNNIDHTINNYFRFEDAFRVGNAYWIYDGTDTGSQHQAKWTPISDFVVEFTSKINDTEADQMGEGTVGLIADDNTIIAVVGHSDWKGDLLSPQKGIVAEDNSGTIHNADYTKNGQYYYYDEVSSGDTQNWKIEHYGTIIKVYDNDGLVVTLTRSSTLSKLALAAGAYGTYPYLDYIQIENLRVRKYADPEPTVTVGDEQSTLMPQILLHFGEGSGSTAYDATPHNNDCTLSGTSFKKGILGTGLYFSGSASSSCGDIGDIKTLSFFVNPLSLNQPILDLDGGTHYIELSSGKIHLAGNNWQSPKLYVNGKQISLDSNNYSINTLLPAQWYHIEIVNSASISASALTLGKVNASYFVGTLDELRAYNYQRTPEQVKIDFNTGLGIRFK